jgi:prepilin signal peptidase PulO-like enzyme (type II secretory pathway)
MDSPLSPFLLVTFLAFALPISIIDIRALRIPDRLSFPCFFIMLILRLVFGSELLLNSLGAALFSGLVFYAVRAGTGGLGLGDVKYAAVIGLFCGIPGIFAAFFFAALTALVAALAIPRFRPGPSPRPIPFAPFLSAGAVFAYAGSGLSSLPFL